MIIDAHAHIASWPTVKDSQKLILQSQEKYGISYSLISDCDCSEYPSVTKFGIHKCTAIEGLKETLKFVKKHPDKLGALVWINPHNEKLTPELTKLILNNREFIFGLKFHPFESHLRITSNKLVPYLDFAKENHLPVLVHTAQDKYSDIFYLGLVASHYPEVNFVAAHMQLCSDNKAAFEVMKNHPNVYGDTAWVKMSVAKKALMKFGDDRVMFGTDDPIDGIDTLNNPMYQDYYHNFVKLPAKLYHNLMARNAIKLYKLPLGKK